MHLTPEYEMIPIRCIVSVVDEQPCQSMSHSWFSWLTGPVRFSGFAEVPFERRLLTPCCLYILADISILASFILVISRHALLQWVMPLGGLLHLGHKTTARDRSTGLVYRNNNC